MYYESIIMARLVDLNATYKAPQCEVCMLIVDAAYELKIHTIESM